MDRDVIFAVMIAVFGSALLGAVYFGDASPSPSAAAQDADPAQQAFAPNDIRYPLQQQALKERERAKKRKVIQSTAPDTPSEDSSTADDSAVDDSSVTDHGPVGEPDIE